MKALLGKQVGTTPLVFAGPSSQISPLKEMEFSQIKYKLRLVISLVQ